MGLHRITAAWAFQHCRFGQAFSQVGQIQRGGHQHQRQVWIQQRTRFAQQREGQIRITPPLMKFIENYAAHPIQ